MVMLFAAGDSGGDPVFGIDDVLLITLQASINGSSTRRVMRQLEPT
jgi:hypothetical protein